MCGDEAGDGEVEFGVAGGDEAVDEGFENEVGVAEAGPEVWGYCVLATYIHIYIYMYTSHRIRSQCTYDPEP